MFYHPRKQNVLPYLLLSAIVFLLVNVQPVAMQPTASETKKALVILVRFPDISPPVSRDFVIERLRKLDFYIREMSYGRAGLDSEVTEWSPVPDSIKKYNISPVNLEVDKSRVVKLIQDSIDAADAKYNFSRYSFIILYLGAQFKEYGMIGLCGYPGMLGWQQDTVFTTKSGQIVPGGVAIFTSQAHLGTLFHDTAHVWGGVRDGKRVLPCLYDHDLQKQHPTRETGFENALINLGYWDPISCHTYRMDGPPPGISSWSKLRLGWITPQQIKLIQRGQTTEVVLGALEDGSTKTLVVKIPLSESRYYLIENRQPLGSFDPHLPGRGILIMLCDDTIFECRNGLSPVKLADADPSVPHLQGAAFNLPEKGKFTDLKNGIEIRLVEKTGYSYKIRIGKPE